MRPTRLRLRARPARHAHHRILQAMLLAAAAVFAPARDVHAVSVTPNALYIDHRTRSGALTLYNGGDRPEEIDISFAFGVPRSDADGSVTVPLQDDAPADMPSVLAWVRAFPRRLVLQPGERQVVRVLMQPPAGLAPGEYWGRVVIRSRGGRAPIEQQRGDIRFRMDVETVVVTAVNYRNGEVSTGVEVDSAALLRTEAGAKLLLDLRRTGNAAYLGRVEVELVDAAGGVLASASDLVAVYQRLRVVVPLPAGSKPPPGARVEYRVEALRPDLPGGSVLPAPLVRGALEIR